MSFVVGNGVFSGARNTPVVRAASVITRIGPEAVGRSRRLKNGAHLRVFHTQFEYSFDVNTDFFSHHRKFSLFTGAHAFPEL